MKNCYVISWEVQSVGARSQLVERLKKYGAYCPIHNNSWAILAEASAAQIRDYLNPALASGDRVFVVRSGTEAAWWNAYGEKNTEWLRKNL